MAIRTEFVDGPSAPGFRHAVVTPHVERLKFRVLLPDGWHVADLPPEEIDFSKPDAFMPLAVCIASYGAIVFSVAARPKFDTGTVFEWAAWLISTHGVKAESVGPGRVGPFDAAVAEAVQESDAGPMRMRLYFFEDGGTLHHVSAMAPDALWASAAQTFDRMLASLDFMGRTGPTVALHPEMPAPPPEPAEARKQPTEKAAPPAKPKKTKRTPAKSSAPPPEPQPTPTSASAPSVAASGETTFASLALAADTATLDPEQRMNVHFRDSGAGLVPRVLERDDTARRATVGAGAIRGLLAVPYGWHVVDDGRRTLVFDAQNRIQVNLALVNPEGGSDADLLESVLREYQAVHPALQHLKMELAGMKCLALRGVKDGDTLLEQAFLVRPAPGGLLLKVRVTGLPDDMSRAMDLAGLLLENLRLPE